MPIATCHCGTVKVEVPREPETITDCNCSICRRYGVLWAYYKDAEVTLTGPADARDGYVWGDRSQTFIRCKHCGCVMQWKKMAVGQNTWTGVNARNFDPAALGAVRIRLLDGASTRKYVG